MAAVIISLLDIFLFDVDTEALCIISTGSFSTGSFSASPVLNWSEHEISKKSPRRTESSETLEKYIIVLNALWAAFPVASNSRDLASLQTGSHQVLFHRFDSFGVRFVAAVSQYPENSTWIQGTVDTFHWKVSAGQLEEQN